jgi:hypothetical protein
MNERKPLRQNTAIQRQDAEAEPIARLGPDVEAKIGQMLRMMYTEVVNQGVPDRFVEILRALDDPPDQDSKNGDA